NTCWPTSAGRNTTTRSPTRPTRSASTSWRSPFSGAPSCCTASTRTSTGREGDWLAFLSVPVPVFISHASSRPLMAFATAAFTVFGLHHVVAGLDERQAHQFPYIGIVIDYQHATRRHSASPCRKTDPESSALHQEKRGRRQFPSAWPAGLR